MDLPVEILIAIGGGLCAYGMNRLVDRERLHKGDRELRDWIQENFVPREVLDSKIDAIYSQMKQLDTRISRMHNENSGKLDSLLSIVSSLSGLTGKPVRLTMPRLADDPE